MEQPINRCQETSLVFLTNKPERRADREQIENGIPINTNTLAGTSGSWALYRNFFH